MDKGRVENDTFSHQLEELTHRSQKPVDTLPYKRFFLWEHHIWQSCNKPRVPFLGLLYLLSQMASFNRSPWTPPEPQPLRARQAARPAMPLVMRTMRPDFQSWNLLFSLLNTLWFDSLFEDDFIFPDWQPCLVHNPTFPEMRSFFPKSSPRCQVSLILPPWTFSSPGDKINSSVQSFWNPSSSLLLRPGPISWILIWHINSYHQSCNYETRITREFEQFDEPSWSGHETFSENI